MIQYIISIRHNIYTAHSSKLMQFPIYFNLTKTKFEKIVVHYTDEYGSDMDQWRRNERKESWMNEMERITYRPTYRYRMAFEVRKEG